MSKKKGINKTADTVLTINEFLSSYSNKRNLDDAFRKWFSRKDASNPKKTVGDWKKILSEFYA